MKLTPEIDRLKHPLAKRISVLLWELVFNLRINEKQIACMQTTISALLAQPSAALFQAHKENPEAGWCCIILGNPDANDDDLIQVANRLRLSSGTHLKLAAAMGRLSLVEKILSQASLDALIADNYSAFRWAANDGHLAILKYLEQKAPGHIEEMIKAADYAAFRGAAREGHLAVLKYFEQKAPTLVEEMTKPFGYYAFHEAAKNGHLAVLEYLEKKAPILLEEMITVKDYTAFKIAAENGHLAILEYLEQKAPTLVEEMIKSYHYEAFRKAAKNGHLAVLKHLEQKAPTLLENMVKAYNYEAFCEAARETHFAVLEYLEQKAPTHVEAMIKNKGYGVFRRAARKGHPALLEHLEQKAPTLFEAMIKADKYAAFRGAAKNGHLAVLEYFKQKAPTLFEAMIKADRYGAFCRAAERSHLAVIEYFEEKAPTLAEEMMKAVGYTAVYWAVRNGHLELLEHLDQKAPTLVDDSIKDPKHYIFIEAAKSGHLEVLEYLERKVPTLVEEMFKAENYAAFRKAAERGHLAVLEHLEEKAPTLVEEMIKAANYDTFRLAAREGHLAVLKHLEEKAPTLVEEMIKNDSYIAFRSAAERGHLAVLEYLEQKAPLLVEDMIEAMRFNSVHWDGAKLYPDILNHFLPHAKCFAHVEMHQAEYSPYVSSFVTSKLTELKTKHTQITAQNPNVVFDLIDENETKLCFYFLRNIIRRHDQSLVNDVHFLLQIPAVKAVAHVEITPGEPNELIRLALTTGNSEVAAILLNIPAVRTLAEQNDFYSREINGELDLRALAQNSESSMKALTIGEQQRLQSLTTIYQPIIQQTGAKHFINAIRQQLKERYEANPALTYIEENSLRRKIHLPFTWEAFEALTFTIEGRERALKSYYQNKNHSAWRYLLKPNPWMHPNASYVYTDDTGTQSWSSFEEYQPLIVLLWLAATDTSRPPIGNLTLEGRLDHFIDELSLIARAHNWDQTRRNNQGQLEEYDDLEGDKPSCYSGVKRRLFQSLLGHPLFTILTVDIIDQELRDFIRTHFREKLDKLSDQEKIELRDIYQEAVILMEEKDFIPLRTFDISPEKQQQFIAALREKYGAALNENPGFEHRIMNLLRFQEKGYPHLVIWGERVGIATLFPAEQTTNISMTP